MHEGLQTLTDREKEALRLLLIGHDAKSAASALGLSVHTVNERLRDSRRKIGVTSSREAARILGEAEDETPKKLGDKKIGVADGRFPAHPDQAIKGLSSKNKLVLLGGGITVTFLLVAALLFAISGADDVASVADNNAALQAEPQEAPPPPAGGAGIPAPGMAVGSMDVMPIADTDGDGTVSRQEYQVFSAQGWGFVSQGKDSVHFAQLDVMSQTAFFGIAPNADGIITRQMYIDAIPNRFVMFDQNGDGGLSAAEINGTAFQQ